MMNKVTSLADLFFKAKTDKRYERLVIRAVKGYSAYGEIIDTIENAKIRLTEQAMCDVANGYDNCRLIVDVVNHHIPEVEMTSCDKSVIWGKYQSQKKYIYTWNDTDDCNVSYINYEESHRRISTMYERIRRETLERPIHIMTDNEYGRID